MKKQYLFLVSLIIIFIGGCSKEKELKKSVYVSDPENPELPLYSEWGYNTFGAYYDREAFVSNNDLIPAKVIVTNNTTSFLFQGQKGSDYYYPDNDMSMSFVLDGYTPGSYTDLVTLNDTIFDLHNPSIHVIIKINTIEYIATIINGTLEIKRAQNLLVDQKLVEVILSGHFDFQALISNEPVTVSDGRFDVGIGDDNFYKF